MVQNFPGFRDIAMKIRISTLLCFAWAVVFHWLFASVAAQEDNSKQGGLEIAWKDNLLTIQGEFPGKKLEVWYLEAYCRPDSREADWSKHTVIGHRTRQVYADQKKIKLQCRLNDGVIVDHLITAHSDHVDFQLVARNPTDKISQAHWAQPCIRVGAFTGLGKAENPRSYEYLKASFVFQNGRMQRMPTQDWATKARYVPGQVWRAPGVKASDVNPRPLNPHVPDNGLIGCFSADSKWIMATAWEPYQELFQGVITCLHSDFRIGGLKPGESKKIRGKIYIIKQDQAALLARYRKDFPRPDRSNSKSDSQKQNE